MEKYSRGWRGAPAKGVGRVTGARVQIPLSPLFKNTEMRKIKKSKKLLTKINEYDILLELSRMTDKNKIKKVLTSRWKSDKLKKLLRDRKKEHW